MVVSVNIRSLQFSRSYIGYSIFPLFLRSKGGGSQEGKESDAQKGLYCDEQSLPLC
jgi:hypothetical protein